ncbi:MAG TPA: c-type cytochrome [Gallionella sp.]|nr:c-type cytochrome [Gallionella sp.]
MTNMQKPILIAIASLALLYGCGGKNKEVAAPVPAPPATATPNAAAASTSPAAPQPQPNEAEPQAVAAAPDLATGEKVYKSTCSICHKSGLGGAPRMNNKQDWGSLIAQGNEVLYDRAINGYRGSKGFMPPRGANIKLSEREVKAAVDYMVTHTIQAGY